MTAPKPATPDSAAASPRYNAAEDADITEAEWRDRQEPEEPTSEDDYGNTPEDYVAIAHALDTLQNTMALDATMLEGMSKAFVSLLHERERAISDLGGKTPAIGTLYSRLIARGFLRAVERLDRTIHKLTTGRA